MDMLMMGVSTSPWKRVAEQLQAGECLLKTKNARGLTVYRVVKA